MSGVGWGAAALSTGIWTGVLLKDVLETVGYTNKLGYHVEFEGLDYSDESKAPYISSIPLQKAVDPFGDVLLCFGLNHESLT